MGPNNITLVSLNTDIHQVNCFIVSTIDIIYIDGLFIVSTIDITYMDYFELKVVHTYVYN